MSADAAPVTGKLRLSDLARVASVGVRTRRLRATLSALGIAIGVAAIVAVLGLSSSSQAGLLAEIDRLGTNLLTAESGRSFAGAEAQLPLAAPARVGNLAAVESVAHTATIDAKVYRTPLIPAISTNALQVRAASLDLPEVVATEVAQGRWLNPATATQPVVVLGSTAARRLGFDRVTPGLRVWLGGQWFFVAGILRPTLLASELDTSALVGYPAAEHFLNYVTIASGKATAGPPSTLYVRADTGRVA